MAVTSIVTDQFKKITTFVYILIILFIINVISNLNFKWDVIPIIVNVYLYVFSFYLIYNFSLLEIHPLKDEYRSGYRRFGVLILFIKTRIVPFVIIYSNTVIYTLINFVDKEHWPWNPILELLDGRFSNTVFYSLILLIILKFNRRPKITLLLFVAGAALYFLIYQLVFLFSPSGATMSGLKFFQITLALILLIYEFMADRFVFDKKKILKSIGFGVLIGIFIYSSFVGSLVTIYKFKPFASFPQARSGQILMRLGYSFPLNDFKSIVTETSDPYLLYDLIYYSREYHRHLTITPTEWENLILSGSMEVANIIAFYIQNLNITVSYQQIISYAERQSIESGETLLNSVFYTRYTSQYCEENIGDMTERFASGNQFFKIWIIRVTAESKCISAIPFLLTLVTDIDPVLAQEAYTSLTKICGIEPAKDLDLPINSPQVIVKFNEFYQRSRSTH
ncbi:MAG: hypothetical protein A2176_13770 [Spirochaetes bacterium RBG_13_51_14]|nr:MAG: hypothetical protein A2176_13770 [Spirochaetes bacterium RBG_13_51_14]